jgi:hypothetical protein
VTDEQPGGSVIAIDHGCIIVRPGPDGITLTHYDMTLADDDKPTLHEHHLVLTEEEASDLIDALMAAYTALIDAEEPRSCMDCGRDVSGLGLNEFYMLTEDLWDGFNIPIGELCVECVEKRLGRELTPADFADVPANGPDAPASALLRSRREVPPQS